MAKPYETVTILSCQFKHMCDEIDELKEYKKKNKDTLDKIRAEIDNIAFDLQDIDSTRRSCMVVDLDDTFEIIDKYKIENEEE